MEEEKNGGEPVTPKVGADGKPIEPAPETPATPAVDSEGKPIEPAPATPASDPLDAIEDEVVRNQAKKDRRIGKAVAKGEKVDADGNPITADPTPPATPTPETPATGAATKDDLKVMNQNTARTLVPQEVIDVWDKLLEIPLGGYNSMDPDSIAKNFIERFNIYRSRNPADPANPAAPLIVSPKIPVSGPGAKVVTPEEKELPGYKEPVQPGDWFPKTEAELAKEAAAKNQ